jgi:acetyl-CoA carboxylase biotin carboxyl carrier protein
MIEIKKIKDLIKLMVSNDLTELDLQGEGERITLKRGLGESNVRFVTPPPAALSSSAQAGASASPGPETPDGMVTIASPMVGTFYAAASPDAKPFISIGDRIESEQVVCIVEAMKVFNEIRAEESGVVDKILVKTGEPVEFDQPLFLVKPD